MKLPFSNTQKQLLEWFRTVKLGLTPDRTVEIQQYPFVSTPVDEVSQNNPEARQQDAAILENRCFNYTVFSPVGSQPFQSAILLLHGLNERNWDKYLSWASYLAETCQRPVVLFPIAYHINRAPVSWSDPRVMRDWMRKRQSETGAERSLSFANVALSERLSHDPYRFYRSGRQTLEDIRVLARQLSAGNHTLFAPGATFDIFAYSIGAFLAEILLMSDTEGQFAKSRLFVFCGGSIFKSMFGTSRSIMDQPAYERLFQFYCYDWFKRLPEALDRGEIQMDASLKAFNAMIDPSFHREEREAFFDSARNRLSGIALQKDRVMPFTGIEACMGEYNAEACFEQLDFPFMYTHEAPFPLQPSGVNEPVDKAFQYVFQRATHFLAG